MIPVSKEEFAAHLKAQCGDRPIRIELGSDEEGGLAVTFEQPDGVYEWLLALSQDKNKENLSFVEEVLYALGLGVN